MGINLSQEDFSRLTLILSEMPDFRTETGRIDFVDDVFAGSPRRSDVLGLLNLAGNPRGAAVRLITRLTQFGQDEPGQETLGVLINKLLTYTGGGEDADFLRDLFHRYPLKGDPAAARGIDEWRGRERPQQVQEKIIGENTLRDVVMLELGAEAAKGVVHIHTASQQGTGFLAGLGLIMTNNHVISSEDEAAETDFTFNYQLDRERKATPVRTTRALPDGLFYTDPGLDFTVVEIEKVPQDVKPLALAQRSVRRDGRVNIIQHPGGHYKKISMQNNFVAFASAHELQYLTSTMPGSSGAPIFNNAFLVVGIHHSGGNLREPGSSQIYQRNEGSSMIAILDLLREERPDIYGRLNIR